jgi:hypothetical protein
MYVCIIKEKASIFTMIRYKFTLIEFSKWFGALALNQALSVLETQRQM